MTERRVAQQGTKTSPQAAGRRDADVLAQSMKDAPVRELLVAGGLRGFTPGQMFPDRLYVEVSGCTGYVNGERGTVKALHYGHGPANAATAVFFTLDERPAMLFVELGERSGERRQHAEVASAREITRDEFDRITGLESVRREMGWTL